MPDETVLQDILNQLKILTEEVQSLSKKQSSSGDLESLKEEMTDIRNRVNNLEIKIDMHWERLESMQPILRN